MSVHVRGDLFGKRGGIPCEKEQEEEQDRVILSTQISRVYLSLVLSLFEGGGRGVGEGNGPFGIDNSYFKLHTYIR